MQDRDATALHLSPDNFRLGPAGSCLTDSGAGVKHQRPKRQGQHSVPFLQRPTLTTGSRRATLATLARTAASSHHRVGTLDTGHPEGKDAACLPAELRLRGTHRALCLATWAHGTPGHSHGPERRLPGTPAGAQPPVLRGGHSLQARPRTLVLRAAVTRQEAVGGTTTSH